MAMTGSSSWTRFLLLAPLLLAVGCKGESQLPVVSKSSSPPSVGRVDIVPSTVQAGPGEQFQLKARAFTPAGMIVDLSLHPCLSLEWYASQAGVLSAASANTVLVTTPSTPGATQVWAEVSGTESDDCNNSLIPEPITSDDATIHTVVVATMPSSDQVHAEKLPADDPVALLIQGESGGTAITDLVIGAVGVADLQKNVSARASDGISEMIAFAKGRSVLARGPDGTSAAWTTAQDIIDADPLPDPDLGFRLLPVMVGLPSDGSVTATWAKDQIDDAAELLDDNRVGIGLDYIGDFQHEREDPTTGLPLGVTSPVAACETGNVNVDIGTQPDVDGGSFVLYVLFVESILTDTRGWACSPDDDWSGRVIYISSSEYSVTTVAHEIVHVLGLRSPYVERKGAHTTEVDGFDESNLMWGVSSLAKASLRDHLSLGQAYRMNFHPASWLNDQILKDAPDQLMTRACETKIDAGVCPALSADLGG